MKWDSHFRTCRLCGKQKGIGVDHTKCSKELQRQMAGSMEAKNPKKRHTKKHIADWSTHVANNYT